MTADSPDATRAGSRPPRSRAVQFAAIGVGVVMALLVVLLVTRKAIEDRTEASPVVGKKAPELAGQPYIGRRFDIGKNDRYVGAPAVGRDLDHDAAWAMRTASTKRRPPSSPPATSKVTRVPPADICRFASSCCGCDASPG